MGTVIKTKIGKEDLEIASTTAYPTTFTRVTSTGGSQTLTEFPDIWKTHRSTLNAMYHGTDRDSTTITTALGILGTVNARALYLEAGSWNINANVTVPSNITLVCEPGAVLDTSGGKSIAINGGLVASPHQQIFGSSITVTLSANILMRYPQWWGEADIFETIAADDATPSVLKSNWFITSANAGATAITNFDNGNIGQTITVIGGSDTNASTIASGTYIKAKAAFTIGENDSISFVLNPSNIWVETGRSQIDSGHVY